MKKVITLNKKEGETPLEALESFRRTYKEYKNVPMTYAGRLDPMASGKLLILAGDETKNKEKYLCADKEYEFSVLFGFATDTYDILGKVLKNENREIDLSKEIKKNLKYFKGEIVQKYPMYSSKTVKGKPLFTYARSGESVEAPKRKVKIYKLTFNGTKNIKGRKLLSDISKRTSKVKGDFRQKEILKIWENKIDKNENYSIARFKIKCSSGTYVRTIASSLGEKMKIPSLAYSIKRTKILL